MKKLNEVTLEDVKKIFYPSYSFAKSLLNGDWCFDDTEQGIRKLKHKTALTEFWFSNNNIQVVKNGTNREIKYRCLVRANEYGYFVPGISDFRK